MKKVAVIQSNYVPWIGYFAMVASVDLFVVYHCVQYTKNDWRNRNQIESVDGRRTWLSIPIRQNSSVQSFMESCVANQKWAWLHFNTLRHHFSRAKRWDELSAELELLYSKAEKLIYLHEINRLFFEWALKTLGIDTKIVYLDTFPEFDDPTERLISILQHFGANEYLSGPSASNYLRPECFGNAQISLEFARYDQLIDDLVIGRSPVKTTSILQLILEGCHEFRHY